MALGSSGGTTHVVNHGSGATMDALATGTVLAWVYLNDTANNLRVIAMKQDGAFTAGWIFYRPGADGTSLRFDLDRATTDLSVYSATAILTTGWQLVGASWNTAGVDGDQYLYRGTLTTTAAEPTYGATRRVGAGAVNSDAGNSVQVLNNATAGSFSLPGRVASIALFNRQLSLGEIQSWQWQPRVLSGCVLLSHYHGTGTQADLSGNGNNGTVTGATVADHVPLAPPFAWAADLAPYVAGGAPPGGLSIPVAMAHYRNQRAA